jgi:RNA 3'-terminal phosphate cyclase (ATP)
VESARLLRIADSAAFLSGFGEEIRLLGMLVLDGSHGEGGGQVLRTALTLSMATGKPFRIRQIRAKRTRPGLMNQHLTAVKAAARISGADVIGDALGSMELEFRPGTVMPGDYSFSVGTAGSTTLIFQTLMPALLLQGRPFSLDLEGGTHNPSAPNLDFLERVYLPALHRIGVKTSLSVERRGFYPVGGGRWSITVEPPASSLPLEMMDRGSPVSQGIAILWTRIPRHVPEQQASLLRSRLGLETGQVRLEEALDSIGPGNAILAELAYEGAAEIVSAYGERGKRSDALVEEIVREFRDYEKGGAPVGSHLADQLMVPLALGPGGSYRTLPLTLHSRTNIETIGRFLDRPIEVTPAEGLQVEIRIP